MDYPIYFNLGDKNSDYSCCVQCMKVAKTHAVYYRVAGDWNAQIRFKDGKWQYKIMDMIQFRYKDGGHPCTFEEWEECNKGYI